MKNRFDNKVSLAGYLYQHKLEKRVTGPQSKNPGTEYIRGSIDIATDIDCTNTVTVNFSYEVPTNKNGSENKKYTFLNNVLTGVYKTVMEVGKENATRMRCDSVLELNEFYTDRNGQVELVSAKRCGPGFCHVDNTIFTANDNTNHNGFSCDMVITNVRRVEANEERGLPEKVVIKGCIFDFRKAVLPVEFNAYTEDAKNYYESLDASPANPFVTQVGGEIVSQSIERRVEESRAFGPPAIKIYTSTKKDMEVQWAGGEPGVWDDPSWITADELKKAMQDRELMLATLKNNWETNRAQRSAPAPAVPAGEFNFGNF